MKSFLKTLGIIASIAAVILVVLSGETATAATPQVVEAESMSWSGSWANIADSNASGGRAISVNSGSGTTTGTTGSIEGLTVRARGVDCFGQAVLRVLLDGQVLGSKTMISAYADYSFTVNKPAGTHTLRIEFPNSAWFGCTRQLVVDKTTLMIGTPTTTPPTTLPTTTTTTTPPPTTTTPTPTTTTVCPTP